MGRDVRGPRDEGEGGGLRVRARREGRARERPPRENVPLLRRRLQRHLLPGGAGPAARHRALFRVVRGPSNPFAGFPHGERPARGRRLPARRRRRRRDRVDAAPRRRPVDRVRGIGYGLLRLRVAHREGLRRELQPRREAGHLQGREAPTPRRERDGRERPARRIFLREGGGTRRHADLRPVLRDRDEQRAGRHVDTPPATSVRDGSWRSAPSGRAAPSNSHPAKTYPFFATAFRTTFFPAA